MFRKIKYFMDVNVLRTSTWIWRRIFCLRQTRKPDTTSDLRTVSERSWLRQFAAVYKRGHNLQMKTSDSTKCMTSLARVKYYIYYAPTIRNSNWYFNTWWDVVVGFVLDISVRGISNWRIEISLLFISIFAKLLCRQWFKSNICLICWIFANRPRGHFYSQRLTGIRAWLNNHIYCFRWHALNHLCPNFNHGRVITLPCFKWYTHLSVPNPDAVFANLFVTGAPTK